MIKCRECNGTGVVEFTKERGGPTCNNCTGLGFISRTNWITRIASILDHPNIYMGGPSKQSQKRAERIIEALEEEGVFEETVQS